MMAMPASDLPTKSRDEYKQLAHIGRGAYGDVFLCEHVGTGERLCVKEVDLTFRSPLERVRCLEEVALLQQLPPHPNIVGFREAFWTFMDPSSEEIALVLVLEHADAGDLEQSLRNVPINEVQARELFKQIGTGVSFLHAQHVVHRDLKSSNVFLFQSGRAVLGDFGTAKRLLQATESGTKTDEVNLTSTLVGSPLYMSPELLEGEPHGLATDIWSLGCVLYELLSGGGPAFAAPSYPAVVFRVTQGTYDPLDANLVSSEALELLAKMLQKAPQQRPTIEQVLRFPWLQQEEQDEGTEEVKEVERSIPIEAQCLEVLSSYEAVFDSGLKHSNLLEEAVGSPHAVKNEPGTLLLPPPAPVTESAKPPILRAAVGQRHHRLRSAAEAHRYEQVVFPSVQLDLLPPPPPVLPLRKRVSAAPSIPSKHRQHQIIGDATTTEPLSLMIRGVQATRTVRKRASPSQH